MYFIKKIERSGVTVSKTLRENQVLRYYIAHNVPVICKDCCHVVRKLVSDLVAMYVTIK